MVKRIEILKDSINQSYIGVYIQPYEIESYINIFKEYLNDSELYELYSSNRIKRDDYLYHITLFPFFVYNNLKKELDKYIGQEVKIDILGLGKAENNTNKTFFLIINSPDMNIIRTENNLKPYDLHITIGFDKKDVFNQSKGLDSMIVKIN